MRENPTKVEKHKVSKVGAGYGIGLLINAKYIPHLLAGYNIKTG